MVDPRQLAQLLTQLGITGIDPTKLASVMQLAEQLGKEVSIDNQDLPAYLPKLTDIQNFYIPKGLKKLSEPNARMFRRLLGIKDV